MTTLLRCALGAAALAGLALAATPQIKVSGEYLEARTADVYTGPCFANSEVQLVGNLAVFGWKINQGQWKGVPLNGLSVVAAVRANSTLGDATGHPYPVRSWLMVDEKASIEQREALKQFARRMTGDLLSDMAHVEAMPIEFTVAEGNIHGAEATLSAGTLARLKTRAIHSGDHICSNEEVFYAPLSKLDHAMPAYALEHSFMGQAADWTTRWSSPDKRSAFVGTFHLSE